MIFQDLFEEYYQIVIKADQGFNDVKLEFPDEVRCENGCSDCCHAVFGLFLIEAAFIKEQFSGIAPSEREKAVLRCDRSEEDLARLEEKLKNFSDDPRMAAYTMSRERVRCPLLNEKEECVLYEHRPVTCRVYGVPSLIRGKVHVCAKSGFEKGMSYPAYSMDEVQRQLYMLSRDLLERLFPQTDKDNASLLISMPRALKTPLEDIIAENFG